MMPETNDKKRILLKKLKKIKTDEKYRKDILEETDFKRN